MSPSVHSQPPKGPFKGRHVDQGEGVNFLEKKNMHPKHSI